MITAFTENVMSKRIPLICIKRWMWNFEAKMRNFLHLFLTSSVSIRRHFLCCWIQKPPSFRTWCKFIHRECVLFSILQWNNWMLVQWNSICDIRKLMILTGISADSNIYLHSFLSRVRLLLLYKLKCHILYIK